MAKVVWWFDELIPLPVCILVSLGELLVCIFVSLGELLICIFVKTTYICMNYNHLQCISKEQLTQP